MTEMIDRVKRSRLPYSVIGRKPCDKRQEWFIDDPDGLPAGEFVAGPFVSEAEADDALETMNVRAALEAMREPTEAMIVAGCRHENMGDMAGRWRAMVDEALR